MNALDGGIRERVEMPGIDQQLNPAFSPDGSAIVFRGMRGGRADIYAYHVGSKMITNLTDDDAFDFAPVYSPDGRWIYYSSIRGTTSKIFRMDATASDQREQVTYGDWNDEDPSLSPDGKRLFFTSDRDGNIFNIYSINLDTGETFLHTNVVGGTFTPTVFTGKDNAESSSSRRITSGGSRSTSPIRRSRSGSLRTSRRRRPRSLPAESRPSSRPFRSRSIPRRSTTSRAGSSSSRTRRSSPA